MIEKIKPNLVITPSGSYEAPLDICSIKMNELIEAYNLQEQENKKVREQENKKLREAIRYLAKLHGFVNDNRPIGIITHLENINQILE